MEIDNYVEAFSACDKGGRGCAVPSLEEAPRFNLLYVMVKQTKELADTLTGKPSIVSVFYMYSCRFNIFNIDY